MRRMHEACFALLTLMCSVVLSRAVFADDSVVDEIGIGVPISCTLSGTGMSSHTANIPNGIYSGSYTADGVDYTDGIGSTTLKAMCNDNEGFAIYAAGYTGDEIGGTNSTNLVGTSASDNSIIATGTATGPVGSDDISNWAMKLDTVTSPAPTYPITIDDGFNSYSAVPSSYTKVAHRDSATDIGPNGVGSTLTTTYAAYISKYQPADTYSGKVIYTLVHPSGEVPLQPQTTQSGQICYYANANTYEGTMGCQTIPASGTIDGISPTSATLLASNFSRDGYGFAGWTNKFDYATNPNQEGIKFYGPQETITYENGQYVGEGKGLSLYAVWIKSAGNLQDTAKVAELCGIGTNALVTAPTDGTANLKSVSALTDQRDNETYAIAKLADGKCWMIENLRLESTNSDNSTGALAQGYGTSATYGNFSGLADAESDNFSNSTTANSLYYYGTQSGDATINIGTTNYPDRRMPRYNNWNNQSTSANRPQNPTSNSATNSTTNAGMYSYGNYYTWHAAIADLTYNGTDNQSTTNTSLCPTGWYLPTGGLAYASGSTSGVNVTGNASTFREFYNLGYKTMDEVKTAYEDTPDSGYAYYSSNTTNTAGKTAIAAIRSFPNNFLYSGFFTTSSAYSRGIEGYYWSSTAVNDSSSYYLDLYSYYVYPGTYISNKSNGFSIRCTVSAGT